MASAAAAFVAAIFAAARAAAVPCVSSRGYRACTSPTGLQFYAGPALVVTSPAVVASGRRLVFADAGAAVTTRGGDASVTLQLRDHELGALYSFTVTAAPSTGPADAPFTVSGAAAPGAPPPACHGSAAHLGGNRRGGDLEHFRQPGDSANPGLCRQRCCAADDCAVWQLMETGDPGLGPPCVAGKPCCYLKSAAADTAAADPEAVAWGSMSIEPAAPRGLLHNLELEFDFDPAAAGGGAAGTMVWLPNLHRGICVDPRQQGTSCLHGNDTTTLTTEHFFRSPAVMAAARGAGFAVVPDVELIARQQRAAIARGAPAAHDFDPDGGLLPQALDLHAGAEAHGRGRGREGSLPVTAWYGVSSSHRAPHEYGQRDNVSAVNLSAVAGETLFSAAVMLWSGGAGTPHAVVRGVTAYLWAQHGARHLRRVGDPRPQIMPFADYPRRFSYNQVLFDPTISDPPPSGATTAKAVSDMVDGHRVWGLANMGRDGANFHAWENDVCSALGIAHYASAWGNSTLAGVANGILQLAVLAPTKAGKGKGAFPSIYNFRTRQWVGTIPFANPAGGRGGVYPAFDHRTVYDNAGMGVTAWWLLYHLEHVQSTIPTSLRAAVQAKVEAYGDWVETVRLVNGAVPTFLNADLSTNDCGARPKEGGCVSATSAISGAVVAKLALRDRRRTATALAIGEFVAGTVLPTLAFYDFETFFSCNNKPVNWTDTLNGMKPINTLSVGWVADQMLALYVLTGNATWLAHGEYALGIFNLFQQVWSPPRYEQLYGYLFGGYGAGNTDGEWSDREHRAVPTLVDYYVASHNVEYLERAVAGARAAFGLMHMPPNYEFNITRQPDGKDVPRPGVGYSPENILHGGEWDGFSGFNWGGGGAATAAAYLEMRFGGAVVDVPPLPLSSPSSSSSSSVSTPRGVGIDGVDVAAAWTTPGSSAGLGAASGSSVGSGAIGARVLAVTVTNALAKFGVPSGSGRVIRVTVFGFEGTVVLNGVSHPNQTAAALEHGGLNTTV